MREHPYFDKFVRQHKMRPVKRVEAEHGSILLADSGEMIVEGGRMFFRTAFGVMRDGAGLDVGSFGEYELGEPGGSQAEQKFRLDDAELAATQFMAQLHQSGYYDGERKNDFSQRPSH
ncbi:MAG: hypothetical protein V3U60_11065 [Gammaproteobacteria bacterium]